MLVVGLELFLIQSDYCCCVFLVVMPVVCSNQRPALLAAAEWLFRCHRKVKIYGSTLPTTTKEDSDGVSLQTAKPLDDHQRNTHDNEPKSHMVFLEK